MERTELLWPATSLLEVLRHLCEHGGLSSGEPAEAPPQIEAEAFSAALASSVAKWGLEAKAASVSARGIIEDLSRQAPALIHLEGEAAVVAVVAARPSSIRIIDRTGAVRPVSPSWLQGALTETDDDASETLDPARATDGVDTVPLGIARALALCEPSRRHRDAPVLWSLRPSSSAGLWRQLVAAGLHHTMAAFAALYGLRVGFLAASWWMLGSGALNGTLGPALLAGWALALGTYVLLGAVVGWLEGHLLLAVNARYRAKILDGALKILPRSSVSLGRGQLLGRIYECEAFDTLAMTAGVSGLTAAIDVALAFAVFLFIPGGGWLAALLGGWLIIVAAGGRQLYRVQKAWTRERISMSEGVVEGLLGRRTRIAQTSPDEWHRAEDRRLETYLALSRQVDRAETSFETWIGQGWLLLGLVTLAVVMTGQGFGPGPIAASMGGVLLTYQALNRVATSVHLVSAVMISWQQAKLLYRSSATPRLSGVLDIVAARFGRPDGTGDRTVLWGDRLSFRPVPERDPIVDGATLSISSGDRILLTGPSGGGKSTLAGLLSGLDRPSSGSLLLHGLDLPTLGQDEWSRRIAYVPPHGSNHVFSDSFLLNLLPGQWPWTPERVSEAEQVCEELGLGRLLQRMPGHLNQIVGETGWRLSHGEQARLFLARAILQEPEIVILDESFGALDPATFEAALSCTLRRCRTLMVISHV